MKEQKEIIEAVREFLSRKEFRQKIDVDTLTDDDILFVAENPVQYNLFSLEILKYKTSLYQVKHPIFHHKQFS